MGVDTQLNSGTTLDGEKQPKETFENLNLQLSFASEHKKSDWQLDTSANLIGSSNRANTARYDTRDNQAAKLDLADYLVTYQQGDFELALGHVSYGEHPLLISQINHRGVRTAYRINPYVDIRATAQSGTAITGGANLLGLNRSDHRLLASTLGLEFFPASPGQLRLEFTHLNASVQPLDNLGVGEIADRQESRGWGVRLLSALWDERLRLEGNMAWSRYTNPDDPTLSQGDMLVPTQSSRDNAYRWRTDWQVLPTGFMQRDDVQLALYLEGEKTDPLYRSLTAFPVADMRTRGVGLIGQLGWLDGQWLLRSAEDNIDHLPSILKTRTRLQQASVHFNLAAALGMETHGLFYPDVTLSHEKTHQYALNNPDEELSDFNGDSHLPDQINRSNRLDLGWSNASWNLTYSLSNSKIDNRQIGREEADFTTRDHQVTLGLTPTDNLMLEVSAGRTRSRDQELADITYSNHYGASVNWQLPKGYSLDLAYSQGRDRTLSQLSAADNYDISLGVSQRFGLGELSGQSLNGQWFLRYGRNKATSEDRSFDLNTQAKDWRITAGVSLEF